MKRTFSPSEAAFEGFRVIQRNPAAILTWTALYLVLTFGVLMLFRALVGGDLAALMSMGQTPSSDPSEAARRAVAMISHLAPLLLLALPVTLVLHAVYTTAIFRAAIRPEDRGFQFLKLGGDEFRQVLLYLYIFGVGILGYIALIIGVVIVAAAMGAAAHALGGMGGVARLIGVVAMIALMVAAIWVCLRLSLASVVTFARGRVQLFSTWRLTKGVVWRLLGCYLLVLVFVLLIGVLSWVVSACASAAVTGDWSTMTRLKGVTSPRAMMEALTLGVVIQTAVSALFGAAIRVVQIAPSAAIYEALAAPAEGEVKLPGGLVL